MPAYWLTYISKEESPGSGLASSDLQALINRVEKDPAAHEPELWRIAKSARIGERVYVFKQGTRSPKGIGRGIIGIGEIVDYPKMVSDPTESGIHLRAKIRFQKLVDPTAGFLLPLDAIKDLVPQSLINARRSGMPVPDEVAAELERRLIPMLAGALASEEADSDYDPASVANERERANRAICIRRGQRAFRDDLLRAYEGRCALTGCNVQDVLEAAHISP